MALDSYQILQQSYKLYKENFWSCLLLTTLAAAFWFEPEIFLNPLRQELSLSNFVWILPAWLGASLFWIALILRLYSKLHHFDYDLTDCLLLSIKRLIPTLILGILYIVIVLCGTILLIIPGLILSVTLLFSFLLLITNKSSIFSSLLDSHRLVWGQLGRTLSVLSVPILLHAILSLLSYLVIMNTATTIESTIWLTLIMQAILQILILPFLFAVGLILLHQLEQYHLSKI